MAYSPYMSNQSLPGHWPDRYSNSWAAATFSGKGTLTTSLEGARTYQPANTNEYVGKGFTEFNTAATATSNYVATLIFDCTKFDGTSVNASSCCIHIRDSAGKTIRWGIDGVGTTNSTARIAKSDGTNTYENYGFLGADAQLVRGFRIRDDGSNRFYDYCFADGVSTNAWIPLTNTVRTDFLTVGTYTFGWSGSVNCQPWGRPLTAIKFNIIRT